MACHGRDATHGTALAGNGQLRTCLGQDVARPVEVQEDDPPRRAPQVVHPGDRLLPAVAALVQVHRRAQPVDLVGDGAVVGLEPEARPPRSNTQRLGGPHPRQGPVTDSRLQVGARHDELTPATRLTRVPLLGTVCRGVTDEVRPRVDPCERLTLDTGSRKRLSENGIRVGHVRDLDPQHEPHRVEPGHESRRRAGLDREPRGLPVVDDVQDVLDVALGRQDEGLGGDARREPGELLRRDRVQPREAVGAGDRHDATV